MSSKHVSFSTNAVVAILIVLFFSIVQYGISINLMYDLRPSQCDILKNDPNANTQRHHLVWMSHVGLVVTSLLIVYLLLSYGGIAMHM